MAKLSRAQLIAAKAAMRENGTHHNTTPVRRRKRGRSDTQLERRRRATTWNFHEGELVQLRKGHNGMDKGTFGIVVKRHEVEGGRYVEVIADGDFIMWEAAYMQPVEGYENVKL